MHDECICGTMNSGAGGGGGTENAATIPGHDGSRTS